MNQRQKPKKRKGTTVATVLCFAAAIAIAGTYTFRDYREKQREDELAQAEELKKTQEEEEKSEEASGEARKFVVNEEKTTDGDSDNTGNEAGKESQNPGNGTDTIQNPDNSAANLQQTAAQTSAAHFDGSSMLLWPVDGNILLSYSMDKTVYFQTLDQYKYNPALIIAGAEGDQVICGASGVVKSIDVTAQTGTTVNVDLGNGYELFYGQLKEVPVKVGDSVEAKTVLGYVSQPTKYYSLEGCNVYFEMRKDGQPVNPMEYLVE